MTTVASVNDPFVCKVCGGMHFAELHKYNATNCRLQPEPETNPLVIVCWGCKRVYKQTADWTWASTPEYGALLT